MQQHNVTLHSFTRPQAHHNLSNAASMTSMNGEGTTLQSAGSGGLPSHLQTSRSASLSGLPKVSCVLRFAATCFAQPFLRIKSHTRTKCITQSQLLLQWNKTCAAPLPNTHATQDLKLGMLGSHSGRFLGPSKLRINSVCEQRPDGLPYFDPRLEASAPTSPSHLHLPAHPQLNSGPDVAQEALSRALQVCVF